MRRIERRREAEERGGVQLRGGAQVRRVVFEMGGAEMTRQVCA